MPPSYRPIEHSDLKAIAGVFIQSLNHRQVEAGLAPLVDLNDPDAWERMWQDARRPLFEHVSAHDGTGWLVEQDGKVLGYARTIQREHVCQLTELFVLPEQQHAGLGQQLLKRAFIDVESRSKLILANSNPAAISRYLRSGVYPVSTIFDLDRKAQTQPIQTDLEAQPIKDDPASIAALNDIDRTILGYVRPEEHAWVCTQRSGFLFWRNGTPQGYAYAGHWSGPMACLSPEDMPAILAHAEAVAADADENFGLMVPMLNKAAMMHLIERGFKLDPGHTMYFMADFSPPGLDRYVFSMPGFFV
ncbi:MAG: GNAT family N-acetyltransferase [Pseudomonadota bacterium]